MEKYKLIAHRGNTNGPDFRENSPNYIRQALDNGYYVEVDVWLTPGGLFTGHDNPVYPIKDEDLLDPRFYIHAKSIDTLYYFVSKYPQVNVFFHDSDAATLTSHGEIWTFPGKPLTPKSISVMPEWKHRDFPLPENVLGVCSDYVGRFKPVLEYSFLPHLSNGLELPSDFMEHINKNKGLLLTVKCGDQVLASVDTAEYICIDGNVVYPFLKSSDEWINSMSGLSVVYGIEEVKISPPSSITEDRIVVVKHYNGKLEVLLTDPLKTFTNNYVLKENEYSTD